MRQSPHSQALANAETPTSFVVRQAYCLITAAIHISIVVSEGQTPGILFLLLGILCVFPSVIQFTRLKSNAKNNLLLDSIVHGFFLGIWGLNPFLCTIYVSSITFIFLISGGFCHAFKGALAIAISAFFGFFLEGMLFRPQVNIFTTLIGAGGLIVYLSLIGTKVRSINGRLRQARFRLEGHARELSRLNHLATVINSNLNIDAIMNEVMALIEEVYPFEAMYVLTYTNERHRLEVFGIYGTQLSVKQHAKFQDLFFELPDDADSMFIRGLQTERVIYFPRLTNEMVQKGAEKDRYLFSIKPSKSLVYFPIFINDKVVGGACFINYDKHFDLSTHDIETIQEYLVQVGTAVRNASQFDELSRAKEVAVKAQSKAEASEEAKGRFLANMSHEIRTPLTAIMGYSEALQEDNLNKNERSAFVGHIVRSGQHLLTMINDILDISKIEAHKVTLEKMDSSFIEILMDVESYMKIKAEEKRLRFIYDLQYPIPEYLHTDPTRLKQILLNLCNNAVKFTEEGYIALTVGTSIKGELTIQVTDTGIGIPEQAKAKIFKAFDQADSSTTRIFGGTGLGLCISKNLANLLGGDIFLKSQVDVGSTFTLNLPQSSPKVLKERLIENEQQLRHVYTKLARNRSEKGIPQLSGRVLIAEDNPENQILISRLVRQTGLEFVVVDNGLDAIDKAKKERFDLILLDMQMPVMGGKEAAKAIQTLGDSPPLITFTANVMKHQIDEYRALGFVDIIEKPIVRESLFSSLEKAIARKPKNGCMKVLIAEDNVVNQMILKRYVSKVSTNAHVSIANNGAEACNLVEQEEFDLILMDMEMPVMQGLEATMKIRASGNETPIYIVTGHVDQQSVERCLAAGATGHLSKPLEKEKVLNLIARFN